jgi:hypothetical protein
MDYTVTINEAETEGEQPTTLFATHKANSNLVLDLRVSVRFLLATSFWNIKPPGLFDKNEFYRTLNQLNLRTIAVQCTCPEKDQTTLGVQVAFFLTDSISTSDLAAFIGQAEYLISYTLQSEKLKPFII